MHQPIRPRDAMAQRPRFIVVFEERSERNVTVLSSVLRAQEARGMNLRASRTVLEGDSGLSRMYTALAVAATDLSDEQADALRKDDRVRAVVLNEVRSVPRPVDTDQSSTTHSAEASAEMSVLAGDHSQFSWCLSMLGMTPDYSKATGSGVTLAVLDTGLDLNHPDFTNRVVDGVNGQSFVPGESLQDGHGHGTHCVGIVAGPRASAGGRRYGVAPDVSLLVGKVLDDSGSGSDDQILDAMDWARDQGARIISMSLGSARDGTQPYSAAYEQVASVMLADGVLVIAAAGNESNRSAYRRPVGNPAACPSIMAVASVDQQRLVSPFSCAQLDPVGTLEVCGPGSAVYSSYTGGGYRSISGTSMATPYVAGVAALYRQLQPNLNAQGLWALIESRVQPLAPASDYGRGLVQVP